MTKIQNGRWMKGTSSTSRLIRASAEKIYDAFLDPEALQIWLARGDMTGKVHEFDGREGGRYTMSVFYPSTARAAGKTSAGEDRFTARFVKLEPSAKIIQSITFDSADPDFAGTMVMEVTLEAAGNAIKVTITFTDIPPGINPTDNDAGTRESLEKLALYVE